jgi:hypothetical protein
MEFTSFTTLVRDEVEKKAGDNYIVRLNEVRKNNGLVLSGLTVMHDDSNISPTIYLNNYYDAYINGNITLISVVNDVMDTYHKNKVSQNVDMRYFVDYSKVKDRIVYKLINTEKNRELLEDVPHVEFLDLSIVFQFIVSQNEDSIASILIHNAHTRLWNISLDELYRTARENTQQLLGYEITNMNDILDEMLEKSEDDEGDEYGDSVMKELTVETPMYVISNKNRVDGAACIIYPNLLGDFALSLNSGFYVIPSSVHEVIIVPTEDTSEADDIRSMIREINDTQVELEEILSYSLYYFDKDENRLIRV